MEQGIIEQFVNAIKQDPNDKKTTYSAIVSRIDEEGVIWVYVAGADKDTPTAQTGVEVSKGDHVTVEWRNNKLYIAGNYSNPSAGTERVTNVENAARIANEAAQNAVYDAGRAMEAAAYAELRASEASAYADEAQESANSATESAYIANAKLSIIENVVGVLNIIAEHGTYIESTDDIADSSKWYFIKEGEQEPYSYILVDNPEGSPSENGWYELDDIDDAVRNYVSSHLILDEQGLWLMQDNSNSKLQITSEGVIIHGPTGPSAIYGNDIKIGDENSFHIKIKSDELGFYDGPNKVAYVSNQQLYITQTVVLQQMDLGQTVESGGLGLWSWKIHTNKNGRNNLYLKWIG